MSVECFQKRITATYVITILTVFIPDGSVCQELILLRSAKTLPQNGVLLWESLFFTPLMERYDSEREGFVDLKGNNYKFASYTMFGYGVLDYLELLIQLPVHRNVSTQEGETSSSAGIGDISLQTRLMLHDDSGKCPAINIGTMLRFPTGNERERPSLGDGTIDLGFSAVLTKKIGFFIGHIKLGYIFNGRNSGAIIFGDKLLYMLKGDFIVVSADRLLLKELSLMLGLSGNLLLDDIDLDGQDIDNSHQYRPLNIVPMIRWTPVQNFFMRPRVVIPIKPLVEGGKYFAAQYVLDVKYSF